MITESEIAAIYLPLLKYDDIQERLEVMFGNPEKQIVTLFKGSPRTLKERCAKMRSILEWLWDVAVEHVLCKLHRLGPTKEGKLPHIWWIGCGPMSRLPFHAAGYHRSEEAKNTIGRVISSYAPTVRTLALMRNRPLPSLDKYGADITIVAMPKTPGYPDLDTEEEIEAIRSTFLSVSVLESPAAPQVTTHLSGCTFVHFICHGESDAEQPSNSALLLKDPVVDTVQRLTVREVSAITHKTGAIAYLSACSTAENPAGRLMEEVMHIAGSFQLAGFPHVIGSLWSVKDCVSVELAGTFYRILNCYRSEGLGHAAVAEIFHNAIVSVRSADSGTDDVITWAPFIHFGV